MPRDSDSDDEQMRRAIALSLQQHQLETQSSSTTQSGNRLGELFTQRLNDEDQEKEDTLKAIALSLGKPVEQLTAREALGLMPGTKRLLPSDTVSAAGQSRGSNKKRSTSLPRYWDGAVKLTHVTGFTGPNFIRFEEIVQKTVLKKAVLTAMVVSMEWIEEQFPADVNLCVMLHGRPAVSKQLGPKRVFITPPMKDETFGLFHSKLMLLVHESSLRVVIGSANLEKYDYNDLENVVFIQDFPLLAQAVDAPEKLPRFARDIYDLLSHMHAPQSVKTELFKYDFARAKAHIVASVSGVFEGDDYNRYGHARLAQIVQEMGAANPARPPQVEMQTSSLGGLNATYLHELYRSFSGIDPYANGGKPRPVSKSSDLPPIDIIYPTRETVVDSRLGEPGAGTICLNRSSWRKPTFPKQVMCDAISHREGTLMHSKYIIATLRSAASTSAKAKSDPKELKGWVYCGSHNATMAAWGKLSLSKVSKKPKMAINNWELGVVLPLYENSDIPVTYVRPPPRYKPSQDAWTQNLDW